MKYLRIIFILIIGLPSLIQSKLIRNRPLKTKYHILRNWCKFVIKLMGYKIDIRGLHHLNDQEGVFFVSNHQDAFDPALIIAASHLPMSFISKKQNEKLPLFGSWAVTIENIHFDREKREDNIFMIRESVRRLKSKDNILIFPEGTRSKSSKMNDFKIGSLTPAQLAKTTIIPIVIDNAYAFSQSKVKSKKMFVSFLAPIRYEEYKHLSNEDLTLKVQQLIENELKTFVS